VDECKPLLGGVDLDANSDSTLTGARFRVARVPNRLSGVHLKVKMDSSNINTWRPFDTTLRTDVKVEHIGGAVQVASIKSRVESTPGVST